MHCHCGQPVHYTDQAIQRIVERIVAELGEYIPITVLDRTWMVQRHYIALHGIKAWEISQLGFEEITNHV